LSWAGARMVRCLAVSAPSRRGPRDASWRGLTTEAKAAAILELKRRGRETFGATYYSQMAPLELCRLAGRAGEVQYGALIAWLKRLGKPEHSDPAHAIELVAQLLGTSSTDPSLTTDVVPSLVTRTASRGEARAESDRGTLVVNCPSVVFDHRFVVVGELPEDDLHPAVILSPRDGSGFWYPQVGRHNPLRARRAFSCFVRLGNPGGIWHEKPLPLDARLRVLALEREWRADWSERLTEDELERRLRDLKLIAEKECMVSRASLEPLRPVLHDHGAYRVQPLRFAEPRALSCTAPVRLTWTGGAAFLEIRSGNGDRPLFAGTAASGVTLVMRGVDSEVRDASTVFQLDGPGQVRLRLHPAVSSFVDPPYEWWLEIS